MLIIMNSELTKKDTQNTPDFRKQSKIKSEMQRSIFVTD